MFLFILLIIFLLNSKPISAASPLTTKFGIFYSIWHCRSILDIRDVSKIQQGSQQWGKLGSFHWWGEPAVGYYCPTDHPEILQLHAKQIHDAGIDFIYVDITNWPNHGSGASVIDIEKPFLVLLETWSKIPNAPKIVPWTRLGKNTSTTYNNMMTWVLTQMDKYPSLYFKFEGKPLILGVDRKDMSEDLIDIFKTKGYTVRKMWDSKNEPSPRWNYIQHCQNDDTFRSSQGTTSCNQRPSVYNGSYEQISVASAYHTTYISNGQTSIPKFDGRTFRRQFDAVFNNPGIPIVTITSWNEWIAQRFCLGQNNEISTSNCKTETFPDGSRIFVDQYDESRNRDIEPSKTGKKDYYYELMKSCISLYKLGRNCQNSPNNLCCNDYNNNWKKTMGDTNADGKIDLLDFAIWKKEYLGVINTNKSDFNNDTKINLLDFNLWKKVYLSN